MTSETLVRLYNIGAFHRTMVGSPDHREVAVEIDGQSKMMELAEIERILLSNKEQLASAMREQRPMSLNRVAQPYAHKL